MDFFTTGFASFFLLVFFTDFDAKGAKMTPKGSQNGAQSRLRTSLFGFLGNLDFVRQYNGFAWFSWFRAPPGRPKIDKKLGLKKRCQNKWKKTRCLRKMLKIYSIWSNEFVGLALCFGTFSRPGLKNGPGSVQERSEWPKSVENGAQRPPKGHQKLLKWSSKCDKNSQARWRVRVSTG